jgi:NAD(P)-dependent dehydrogenase (short-subunit alcohol dehydrogenase family)
MTAVTESNEFTGRHALVTGGGRGIGRATCIELARRGAAVTFSYRREQAAADELVAEIEQLGGRALAVACDMGIASDVEQLVETARAAFGPVTLLVNNAAYTHLMPAEQLTPERFRRFLATNVEAPYLATWAVRPDMLGAGGGAVVNVSSLSATSPNPGMVGYATSKGALNSFSHACALAFAGDNIRVNTVVPGLILTPRSDTVDTESMRQFTASIPMARGGQAEEVADAIVFMLSDRATYVTGAELVVAGGQR